MFTQAFRYLVPIHNYCSACTGLRHTSYQGNWLSLLLWRIRMDAGRTRETRRAIYGNKGKCDECILQSIVRLTRLRHQLQNLLSIQSFLFERALRHCAPSLAVAKLRFIDSTKAVISACTGRPVDWRFLYNPDTTPERSPLEPIRL